MVKKLQDNLAAIAALIGVVGAIGAGFVTYGKMQEQINSLAGLDLNPLIKEIGQQNIKIEKQNRKIAILEKSMQVLELQIKEFKAQNSNPLLKWKKFITNFYDGFLRMYQDGKIVYGVNSTLKELTTDETIS